jgi:hypothetical protein
MQAGITTLQAQRAFFLVFALLFAGVSFGNSNVAPLDNSLEFLSHGWDDTVDDRDRLDQDNPLSASGPALPAVRFHRVDIAAEFPAPAVATTFATPNPIRAPPAVLR